VAYTSRKHARNAQGLIKNIIGAVALGTCGFAQAGVLNFETALDSPFLFSGGYVEMGNYWVETYGGTLTSDLAGAIVDGRDRDTCFSVSCPVNNPSNYLSMLNDGYFYFGLNSGSTFRLQGFQASFIGAGQQSFPATSGLLVLQGFDQDGYAVGAATQYGLSGPTGGAFNFASYSTDYLSSLDVAFVRVLGYACDATGSCNRNSNLANFAIDNIVTLSADDVEVPEPGSLALLGLGLLGFAYSRRRAA